MAHVVQLGTGIRHRFTFELRYDSGELYWDRCGRVARSLAGRAGWAVQSVDVGGCHIVNEDRNLVFNYSHTKLDLVQTQSPKLRELLAPGEFAVIAEEFSEVVIQSLEVNSFPRIGFRLWTLFKTESMEDASSRIGRMSFLSPSKPLVELGGLSGLSPSVVVARPKHLLRIAATPFEQQVNLPPSLVAAAKTEAHKHSKEQHKVLIQKMKAQKTIDAYPGVGMMIDLDAYIEEPPYPDQVDIRTFVEDAVQDFVVVCEKILSEETQK